MRPNIRASAGSTSTGFVHGVLPLQLDDQLVGFSWAALERIGRRERASHPGLFD